MYRKTSSPLVEALEGRTFLSAVAPHTMERAAVSERTVTDDQLFET